jgi:hypothetical protein
MNTDNVMEKRKKCRARKFQEVIKDRGLDFRMKINYTRGHENN